MKKTPLILAMTAVIAQPTFAATELPQVVVTANNSEQSLKTVTSPITIITAEEIKEKQAHSLAEVLRNVPGIDIKTSGGLGSSTTIFMRGYGNKSVLVLINGIEMTNPVGTGGTRIEKISVADIQRIEIIQGPQSGIWGSGAAGVINIITKKSGANTAGLEVGSFGFKQLTASLGAQSEKASFRVNLSDLKTDGFTRVKEYNHSNDGYESDAFQQTDISFNLSFNPTKGHTVSAFIKQTQSYLEYDGTSGYPNYTPLPNDKISNSSDTSTLRKISDEVRVSKSFLLELYAQDNAVDYTYNDISNGTSNYKGVITQTGAKGHFKYNTDDLFNLSVESKQLRDEVDQQGYYNTSFSVNNTNTFGNLVLTEAIRQDQFNKFEDKATGKVGAKYNLSQDSYLSANYGTSYNTPTLYQITHSKVPSLKPESSTAYDLSISAFGLLLTYFNQEINDQIAYDPTASWPNVYFNSTGKTKAEGIELSYQRTIEAINTDLSFNYLTQTVKNNNGQWLSYRPDQTTNLQLSYFGFAKTIIGLDTRFVGNKYSADNKAGANIGNYYVTNVYANYEVNHTLTLRVKVKNLFNEDYVESVAEYPATNNPPQYVYNNGGTQLFVGIDGKF